MVEVTITVDGEEVHRKSADVCVYFLGENGDGNVAAVGEESLAGLMRLLAKGMAGIINNAFDSRIMRLIALSIIFDTCEEELETNAKEEE